MEHLKTIVFLAMNLCLLQNIYCQLSVPNTGATGMTPAQFVQNYFVGTGVTVSNVKFNGSSATTSIQIGRFVTGSTTTNLEIASGIILSSGDVTDAPGPNSATSTNASSTTNSGSDADLTTLAGSGSPINDKAVLEFDFIPNSDSIKLNYIFASEEYPEYVGNFNEGLGIFLRGPGITGTFANNAVNIAIIHGTTNTPITLNNVNNGDRDCYVGGPNGPCVNCAYYVDNCGGASVIYDGFTKKMTARRKVQSGQTYHIKIAVGDAVDNLFDSAVFFEAGSFSSYPLALNFQSINNPVQGDTTLTFNFNANVLCNTVDASDFTLMGPDGTHIISGITSDSCTSGAANSNTFTISFNPPITVVGNYTLSIVTGSIVDIYGHTAIANSTTFFSGYSVSGNLSYNNTQQTPMSSVVVNLMLGSTIIATDTSDSQGNFLLPNVDNGNYFILFETTKLWGGVTATDALKLKRHIANLEILTEPIKLIAADVNNSGNITATDILKVQRRIVNLDTSFTRPDWIFEKPTIGGINITINGANISQNFYALCTGDLNGSNISTLLLKSETITFQSKHRK